ncbi:MAG: transcriptional repressor [Lachnospiraceae bacterium]|jgi:Fe2+ or Zn2+ uptake regulation protein|nr:transcriptional repressor [Lachnospiraceae bacterium]MDY6352656.1 transcriptional repressor [Lachnospiraceae bacterium]
MKRFSKRRALILEDLATRTDHPTAEMVYESVRKQIPGISLGTVYRNLKELCDEDQIISFSQNGKEHFDGNNHPHIHVCCKCCGMIWDHPLDTDALSVLDIPLSSVSNVIIQGICDECSRKLTDRSA